MLTQVDLDEINELLDKKLDEKISILPTKEHFAKRMDELSGMMKKIDEEFTLHTGSHDDLDSRVAALEKRPHVRQLVD
ncbi:hypothetical protein HY947_00425 [Candidatus Gottesmanbacteria bacterium]|nr:hypothetical protein [Candidatus Gottesmanbacteria bacterium]